MPRGRQEETQISLGIGEASRLLGVTEATLRHWTDEGRIQAFLTPGGHRRYLRRSLMEFIAHRRKVLGIRDLVARIEDTPSEHREIARSHLSHTPWYARLDEEAQKGLAVYGRRLLDLVVSYVSAPRKRKETQEQVRELGDQFGTELARLGLSLTDCLEAFLLHRTPIVNAVTGLLNKGEAVNGRVIKAMPLVTQVMDEALVPLVAACQRYHKDHPRPDLEEEQH